MSVSQICIPIPVGGHYGATLEFLLEHQLDLGNMLFQVLKCVSTQYPSEDVVNDLTARIIQSMDDALADDCSRYDFYSQQYAYFVEQQQMFFDIVKALATELLISYQHVRPLLLPFDFNEACLENVEQTHDSLILTIFREDHDPDQIKKQAYLKECVGDLIKLHLVGATHPGVINHEVSTAF